MDIEIVQVEKHADERGVLVEFLKGDELGSSNKEFAQIYFATFAPGKIRGCHYHKEKEEWFGIISGVMKVVLEDVQTKERKEIILDSSDETLTRIKIGANIAHGFKNLSKDPSILIAYGTEIHDHIQPDQYDYDLSFD